MCLPGRTRVYEYCDGVALWSSQRFLHSGCFANGSRYRLASRCGAERLRYCDTHAHLDPPFAVSVQVWGRSTKHDPMRCGLAHPLDDEDVLQIVPKTITQQASLECSESDSCRLWGHVGSRPFASLRSLVTRVRLALCRAFSAPSFSHAYVAHGFFDRTPMYLNGRSITKVFAFTS